MIPFGTARTYQAGYKQHGSIKQDGERGAGRHGKAPSLVGHGSG